MATLLTAFFLCTELYSCEHPDGFLNSFFFNLLLSTVLLLLSIDSLLPILALILSFHHFLCCSGGNLGTALFFFSLQIHPILFFLHVVAFLHKTLFTLKTYCLWSTFCLTGISDSLLQPYFLKICSACLRRVL